MEKLEPPCPAGWKVKCSFAKQFWPILKELNTESLYEPATPLVIIYPGEMETYAHTKTCTMCVHSSIIHNSQKSKNNPSVPQMVKG